MRDPSIHITRSQFNQILSKLEVSGFPVDELFKLARKISIDSRAVSVSNNKNHKQITNILLANKGDATLVADLIYSIRVKLNHRGVKKIRESQPRDWVNCKKLAEICNNFCRDFEIDNVRDGFITYLEIGIKRMNTYKNLLQRLISMSEVISAEYEAKEEINRVQNIDRVYQIRDYYDNKISSVTGIPADRSEDIIKLKHFVKLSSFLREAQVESAEDFIDAQFYALEFCNGIPSPEDLYGNKSMDRYRKYLYKIKNNPNTIQHQPVEPQIKGSLWNRINGK